MARERAKTTGIFLHDDIAAFFAGSQMKGSFRFTFNGKFSQTDETISLEKEERLFMQFVNATPLRVYRTNYLVADSSLRLAWRSSANAMADMSFTTGNGAAAFPTKTEKP